MLQQTWRNSAIAERKEVGGLLAMSHRLVRSKAFLEVQNTLERKGSSTKMQLPWSRFYYFCKTSKLLKPKGHPAVLSGVEFYSFDRGCR